MKAINTRLLRIAILSFLLIRVVYSSSQDLDKFDAVPYQKVFVDTDEFDASYLNQLEILLENSKVDSTYFSILNDLAYFSHTRNLNKAYRYVETGLRLTEQAKDSLWYGRFQITQGAILLLREKLDSAEMVLEDAKSKVAKSDLPFLNTQLGYLYERRGELDRAVDYALESMLLAEQLDDTKAIALAYSDLSNLFWKQSKYKVGLEYGMKSVSLFKKVGLNSLDYNFTLFVVGNNLQGLNRYNDARWYFEQCIKMGERYGFYNNLSDVYIFVSELDTRLGKYEKAIIEGNNAVRYAKLLDNNFMLMRSWLAVGEAQEAAGLYHKATISLKKCLEIATINFGDEYYLTKAYETLGRIYAKSGDFRGAYEAFKKYDTLKNVIFTKDADERFSLLQTQFKTAQQEVKIQAQEVALGEQKNRQILTILILFSILVILIIVLIYARINKKKNQLLEKQNKEKEFLLKEIHHRVKNNLGVVSGLLALQSEQIEDASIKDAMLESQNRVNSMSMIHQKLYQGSNLATIELKDYLNNLASHVLDSFAMEHRVAIKVEMQPLELDVDTAVPLGLILNELLTNALKYAFPDNRKGKIEIHLHENIDNYTLIIQDNGVGFESNQPAKGTGFGTQLINLLVTQLEGKITTESNKGTRVSLAFSVDVK